MILIPEELGRYKLYTTIKCHRHLDFAKFTLKWVSIRQLIENIETGIFFYSCLKSYFLFLFSHIAFIKNCFPFFIEFLTSNFITVKKFQS